MNINFSGKVLFANGIAAAGVQVRIFDKDVPGKVDDDLTIQPGLSDQSGHFTVRFSPSKYLDTTAIELKSPFGALFGGKGESLRINTPDVTDVLIPYLQFNYTFEGQARQHTAPLTGFQHEFHLPETKPLGFVPSKHAFKFVNSFPGYPLPFTIPSLPFQLNIPEGYGLCGGMSSGAYDFLLAGREIPSQTEVPSKRTNLHKFLFRRAIDSFGPLGDSLVKVARWTALPDDSLDGTQMRTYAEFQEIRKKLDSQQAVLIALIYESAKSAQELIQKIWNNHQVLAYAYTQTSPEVTTIHLYDPNFPLNDQITIQAEQVNLGYAPGVDTADGAAEYSGHIRLVYGLKCSEFDGDQEIYKVRGFFPMAYNPVEPPKGL